VIADRFHERPLFAPVRGKFDQRLKEPLEKLLPPQSIFIKIFINFVDIAPPPKMHEAMDTVDERDGLAAGGFVAERAALALNPGLEFHLAPGVHFDIGICLRINVCRLFAIILLD
jgi:hypothetical protein